MTAPRPAADRDARTPHVPRDAPRRHALGFARNLASAVAYSTSGFYTRLIPLDPWTILFWRGSFAGLLSTYSSGSGVSPVMVSDGVS